jgi:hypothetical protein
VRASVDERLGDLDGRPVGDRLQDGLLELMLDAVPVGLTQLGGEILAQLGERVEVRGLGGELVVELGQVLGLDLMDGDREARVLAAELVGVFLGEGDGDGDLSCSSKPGISRPDPSSITWSRAAPPSNGSPASVPT